MARLRKEEWTRFKPRRSSARRRGRIPPSPLTTDPSPRRAKVVLRRRPT